MRVELDVAGVPRTAPVRHQAAALGGRSSHAAGGSAGSSSRVLGAFGAVSLWVLALDLFQVVAHGRVWTGTDGVYLVDQMQYLAWIQSASHHVLSANMFVLRGTPADYLQPAITISAALTALGVAPWLALLLWKPVAVRGRVLRLRGVRPPHRAGRVAAASGARAGAVLRLVHDRRRSFGVVGDLFAGFLSWGYTFGLLALGLMVAALVCYEGARSEGSRRLAWAAALLGAVVELAASVAGRAADPDRARLRGGGVARDAPATAAGAAARDDRGDRDPARVLPAARPVRLLLGAREGREQARVLVLDARARARAAADRCRSRRGGAGRARSWRRSRACGRWRPW